MMMVRSLVVCVCVFWLFCSSCYGCVAPDCDRKDCGTCGNACCKLELEFPQLTPVQLVAKLNSTLAQGGPDGRYTLKETAESPFGFGDLRPYHSDDVSFIGQAFHVTAKGTYIDTVNLLIGPEKVKPTRLRAFSISQIGGAYCDEGQNYKNIVALVKSLEEEWNETGNTGCEKPKDLTVQPNSISDIKELQF